MKKICFLLMAITTTILLHAQSNGWQNLFNGKDLTGWKPLNGKAPFEVKNGEIVGTTVHKQPNSFLATEKNYGDFLLEFDFFVDSTINSGVQFRSLSTEDYQKGRVHGYQFEIDPSSRGWAGGIYDEARRGWLYTTEVNIPAKKAFKNNVWNKARIECIGNTLRTWINNIPVSHVVDDMTKEGFIALQVHSISDKDVAGKQIRWKNIRIKTGKFTPQPYDKIFVVNLIPNTVSAQEQKNGFSLLWDGKTTNGWRGAYKTNFPEKGWNIADGELRVQKSDGGESTNGGDIVTVKKYSAFELQFEFKLSKGANSGVKYFVTESEGNKGSAIGLEYQLLDDVEHPDAKMGRDGNRTLASLYDLITSDKNDKARKKIGEWNQGILKVYPDNRVEHWLNGYLVTSYTRGSKQFNDLVAISKYKDWPNFGMAKEGHILLQDHGDNVSFRSLKIKTLK